MAICEDLTWVNKNDKYGNPIPPTPCTKPAVIRYDGKNLCAKCADKNVLAARRYMEYLADNTDCGPIARVHVATLAPKEDV